MSFLAGVEDKDILEVLNASKGKDDALRLDKLRDALFKISHGRADFEKSFREHLKDGSADELCSLFTSALPRDPSYKFSKDVTEKVSQCFLDMMKVYDRFMSRKNNDKVPRDWLSFSQLLSTVMNRVFDSKKLAKADAFIQGSAADEHRSRYWLQNGATQPENDELKLCVLCAHESVDEPASNKTVRQRNEKALMEYNEKCKAVEAERKRNPESNAVSICVIIIFNFDSNHFNNLFLFLYIRGAHPKSKLSVKSLFVTVISFIATCNRPQ